jgi:hypothetical protein
MLLYPLDENVYSMRVVGARTCEYLGRAQCLRRSMIWGPMRRTRVGARRALVRALPLSRPSRQSSGPPNSL